MTAVKQSNMRDVSISNRIEDRNFAAQSQGRIEAACFQLYEPLKNNNLTNYLHWVKAPIFKLYYKA